MSGGEMARAEGLPEGAAPGVGVDLYAQARKALSLRTPFEGEGPAPRVPTLPARLVNWSGPSDARKKHKKIQPEDLADVEHPPQPATEPSAKAGAWEHFEAYFRPVNLDDIDMLMPKFPFRYGELDSCILIPFVGSRKELDVGSCKELDQLMDTSETFDVAVAETSSYLGLGGEERVSNKEHSERSEQSVEQGIHEVVVRQFVSNKERSEQSVEQGIHEVVVQQENWPLEVEQTTGSAGIVSPECENEGQSSLNWLLGAKERFVLTSERPNKKRKLLGVDAGLEQLVLLPPPGGEASSICDVCCLGDSGAVSNRMLNCDSCKVRVHQKCYGLHFVPDGQWLCTWCKDLESAVQLLKKDADGTSSMPCVLCPKEKGSLKPVKGETTQTIHGGNPKFAHLFCSLWTPGALVEDMESMEPVTNVGSVQENQRKVVCSICKVKHGVCVRCSHGTCRAAFHPICARESKHQMEIWGKFGHPKVELRAFCSKHSAIGCTNSVERSASQQSPTEVRANDASLITGKIPKLRFTRKNKDKSMNCKTTSLSSSNLIKVDTVEQTSLPHTVRSSDSLATQGMEVETDNLLVGGNLMSNSADIAVVLRKLIDQGKVSVGDIASEVGISSESLEAALVGETTTFSHGLKLKIIKWLQNSAHIPVAQANTSKGGSIVVHDSKPGWIEDTDSGNMKSSFVPDGKKGTAVDFSDSAVMKSPSTRSKDNSKIMGDIKSICATGVTLLQNGIKKMAETGTDHDCSLAEDCAKEYTQNFCPVGGKDTPKEEHEELIPNSISGNTQLGISMEIPNQNKVTSPGKIRDNLTEAEPGMEREGISSLNQCFSLGDNVKHGLNSVENGVGNNHDFNTDHMPGQPFSNFDDSHYYIHPFIKEKMGQLWDNTFKQNRLAPCHCEDPLCSPGEKNPVDSLIKLTETTSVMDQVSEAKSLDILEHSPDDEVEGELVYLQARLLDTAAVLKDRYEDLIGKVVQNLSRELDAFSKRKWDFIFVNQFLRDVREAKKRGRKEKRNKEAQAILAAAAAAVAASSRNSTVRKDATDDTVSANQQSSPKFSAGPPRAGQRTSSLLRLKDLSKPSNNKVSQDTSCSMFHMPICSKENALYCDVCMRSETVLNRIFVCSRCKAAVHIDCYGNFENSIGPWKCELCKDISAEAACVGEQPDRNGTNPSSVYCDLCHGISGAFRKTADGQWIHAFCAEWLLENKYVRGQDNPVNGMDSLVKDKDTCCVCLRTVGACLKCNSGDCQSTFHPSCAKNAGFYMNTKGFGGMVQHKAYCNKHSIEQKEADMQQYGPEEFNNMKRMRVELEKLRLLCERIIKREKVKRERVLCDHDILAKTKDTLVFSCLAHGASSESATTSVNNKSYSGTMQRSDDVTVDSTISGKKAMRFSLNNRDAEINTADSSRTLISFKRKFSERGSLAGKQLPQRSVASLQKSEAGEKNTKDKKHRETFQKELVMTSDQASTQNQRLPKGYAYVPRDSLSKEKPRNRNTQAHEPQEPGG
uniref:PHD-type domain-containing protein n=1 Tax=Leersia perrieri TaxID=77586 RepID=A0A0D9VLI5_9ORYZ